jgi:hypothetical protein
MSSMFRLAIALAIVASTTVARADVLVGVHAGNLAPRVNIKFDATGSGLTVVPGSTDPAPGVAFTFTPDIPVNATPGQAAITPTSPAAAYSQLRIDIESGYGFSAFSFNFDSLVSANVPLQIEAIDEHNQSHLLSLVTLANQNGQNRYVVEATGGFLTSLILTAQDSQGMAAALLKSFKQPRVSGIALLGDGSDPPVIIDPPPAATVTPEPASLAIWGCVAAGLAAARLGHRRKAAE